MPLAVLTARSGPPFVPAVHGRVGPALVPHPRPYPASSVKSAATALPASMSTSDDAAFVTDVLIL